MCVCVCIFLTYNCKVCENVSLSHGFGKLNVLGKFAM